MRRNRYLLKISPVSQGDSIQVAAGSYMIIFWFLPFLFWVSLIWLSGCVLVAITFAKR